MKPIKNFLWILAFLLFLSIGACSNDDDMLSVVDPITNDDTNPNPQPILGTQGEITLYRVSGEIIEKLRDYQVSGIDLQYQQNVAEHQRLWGLTKKVVPVNHRGKMSEFMIYNGAVDGSAGYVYQTKQDLSQWQMGLAINFADVQSELVYTIIHEFGHILTLNNTQVNSGILSNNCSNFFTGEGCSRDESYIAKMHRLYWADIWSEFQQAQNSESSHQAFYEKYRDRFVTNYAATNPGEDIAEVFATFVTRNDKPAGNTIAEKKILLMYDYAELVQLRDYIRSNSSSRSRGGERFLPLPGAWKKASTLGDSKHSHCGHNHKPM